MNNKTLALLFWLGLITLIAAFAFQALDDYVFQGSLWVWPFVMKLFGSTTLILGFALPALMQKLYDAVLPAGARRALNLPVLRAILDLDPSGQPNGARR